MRKILCIGLLVMIPFLGSSQNGGYPNKGFQPMSVNGAINLGGGYRYQAGTTNQIYDIHQTPVLYGGILLNTSSYIVNPCVMTFNLGGEYNPEIRQEDYLVIPDRSEGRTLERIDAGISLCSDKPLSMGAYTKYTVGYTNRENLTNIKTKAFNWGGNLSWANRVAPLRVTYDYGDWEELETETGRLYTSLNKRLQANLSRSFSKNDKNELIYFHRDFQRTGSLANETRNISDNFNLNNSIFFDDRNKYSFRSMITGTDQIGTDAFRKLFINESLNLNLPAQLRFSGNYTFTKNTRESQDLKQHTVNTLLQHQLYRSLTSSLIYDYSHTTQSYYSEIKHRVGIDLRYEKKIPLGRLLLSGEYYVQPLKHQSETLLLQVFDESHVLRDGELEMLDKPNVILSSIVVKDPTGTIIFQEYLDYIIIEQNVYVEIRRIPGGHIPNNSTVLVDYKAEQEGAYQYNVNYLRFNASLLLFDRLVEIYYRRSQQDYSNLVNTENVTLNYLTQNIYGLKLEYKVASLGAEYEDYNSSVTPFTLWRYYFQLQGNVKNKLLYSFNADYRDYHMIYNDTYQQYADAMGNVAYMFNPQTRLNLELGYRKQIGEGIDLDLVTCRTEFNYQFRELFVKFGVELYRRIRLGEQLDYYNVYIKLTRTFNWHKK